MDKTARALPERLPDWGVSVFESHHASGFQMEWRRHRFLKVVYVLAGGGSLHLEGSDIYFQAGDLLVVPAGMPNRLSDAPGAPASLYVLCVAPKIWRVEPATQSQIPVGLQPRSAMLANRAELLLRRLLYQQSKGGQAKRLLMASATLELLSMLVEAQGRNADKATSDASAEVRRYVDDLNHRFFEATSIDEAASRLGLSRRRFTELFREVTGKPWLAYVHELAIEHAAALLDETDAPIASIAFECGFGDLSTFYRRFKALRGCTPTEWRKQHRGPSAIR